LRLGVIFFATCSPPVFPRLFAVNNSMVEAVKNLDFTNEFELFTRCSPRVFGG
jgi:hypothetical protein